MANYDLTYEGSRVQGILDTGNSLKDAGYIFRGEATPSTVPGTPTERVAYIGGPGTYTNFGSSITVGAGCICVFKYTGSAWSNQVINTGLSAAISSEAESRANADGQLQNAISAINAQIGNGYVYAGVATPSTSPVTGKVFYLAITAGTYTNFEDSEETPLAVTAGINILKNTGTGWVLDQVIAIDAEPTQGSDNLVKSGGVLNSIIQNGPAFDLSAYNAQGGTLATYADLDAALTALNTLPADFKKGGMSFKFVSTSDNKYVQYRLMANTFSTNESDWQGADAKPIAGSKNLAESGGVADIQLINIIPEKQVAAIYEVLTPSDFTKSYIVIKVTTSSQVSNLLIQLASGGSSSSVTYTIFNGTLSEGTHWFTCPYNGEVRLRFYDGNSYPSGVSYSVYEIWNISDEKSRAIIKEQAIENRLHTEETRSQTAENNLYKSIGELNYVRSIGQEATATYIIGSSSEAFPVSKFVFILNNITSGANSDYIAEVITSAGTQYQSINGLTTITVFNETTFNSPILGLKLYKIANTSASEIDFTLKINTSYDMFIANREIETKEAKEDSDVIRNNVATLYGLTQRTNNIYNWRSKQYYKNAFVNSNGVLAGNYKGIVLLVESNASTEYNYKANLIGVDYTVSDIQFCCSDSDSIDSGDTVTKIGSGNTTNRRCAGQISDATKKYLYLYILLHEIDITDEIYDNIIKSLVINTVAYTTEYIDYYKFNIQETQLSQEVQQKLNNATGDYVEKDQGIGNAGKVLKVDVDGNVIPGDLTPEGDLTGYAHSKTAQTIYLKDNLLTSATADSDWSGDYANGFVHTAGSTGVITFDYDTESGKSYIVDFTLGSASEDSVSVAIGDSYFVDAYNGTTHVTLGFKSEGGKLKIKASSAFASSVSAITLKEVTSEAESTNNINVTLNCFDNGTVENNLTGFWNVAIGAVNTMKHVENGSRNIAIGYASMQAFKYGTRNIAIGTFSMSQLNEGERNIAIGADALYTAYSSEDSIGIGKVSLGSMSHPVFQRSIAIGTKAIGAVTGNVNDNVAIGYEALYVGNNNSSNNVCIGSNAGYYAKNYNTLVGRKAGYWLKGNSNVCLGSDTFTLYVTGDSNTLLGAFAGFEPEGQTPSSSNIVTINNSIAIGNSAKITKSNQCVIGNSDVTEFVLGSKKLIFNNDDTVTWETIS